jgi:hypothetical protein
VEREGTRDEEEENERASESRRKNGLHFTYAERGERRRKVINW